MTLKIKSLNLALQGGGSHGAFTWGVLERLLDERILRFEGVSGTSSGAINAVVLAHGLRDGGKQGAQRALSRFWQAVGDTFAMYSFSASGSSWPLDAPGASLPMDVLLRLTREFSPYQLNPLGHNPLRELLDRHVDFEALRAHSPVKLFISATAVRTGKVRIFETAEITHDVLLASACLPSLHHAIFIDGEPYWDGGFTGNPPVYPLVFECRNPDVVIIAVQPLVRQELPTTAEEIRKRTVELGFSTAFLREMRAIAFSKQRIDNDWLPGGSLERKLRRLNVHLIQDAEISARYDNGTRLNSLPAFLKNLHERGCITADQWLRDNFRHVGSRSSIDLVAEFC